MTADIIRHPLHITFSGENVRVIILNKSHTNTTRPQAIQAYTMPASRPVLPVPSVSKSYCVPPDGGFCTRNTTWTATPAPFPHSAPPVSPVAGDRGCLVDARLWRDKGQAGFPVGYFPARPALSSAPH